MHDRTKSVKLLLPFCPKNWMLGCSTTFPNIHNSRHGTTDELPSLGVTPNWRLKVCGLKWSPDGNTLASGGNENYLCLWDASMSGRASGGRPSLVHRPRTILKQHQAAVKALAWCPSQRHLLASGGGTADRTIKVRLSFVICMILWYCCRNERS